MLKVDFEREADGKWIAEIAAIPGVIAYGDTMSEAQHRVEVLALRVIADMIEHGEPVPFETSVLFAVS